MKIQELRTRVSIASTKKKIFELIEIAKQKNFDVKDLIVLTFDADRQIAFHAAWILDNLLRHDPWFILENLDAFLQCFPQVSNISCKRHYARILMHATSPKTLAALQSRINTTDLEPVVETCFDWLIDPKAAVAVKVFCCEALFNLRNRYDWIADELAREVEFLMKDGSAAMQSKGKKLLKALLQQ